MQSKPTYSENQGNTSAVPAKTHGFSVMAPSHSGPVSPTLMSAGQSALQPSSGHLMSDLTMSIKQQETIEQILQQTDHSSPRKHRESQQQVMQHYRSYPHCLTLEEARYKLDEDIDQLLKQSEMKIGQQYDNLAKEQFAKNRIGITITDDHDRLREIFERMDAANSELSKDQAHANPDTNLSDMSEADKANLTRLKINYHAGVDWPSNAKQGRNNRTRSQSTSLLSFEEQPSDDGVLSQNSSQSAPPQSQSSKSCWEEGERTEGVLQTFEKVQILNPKHQSLQILELDQKYPRINPSSMYRHQYPIFKFSESSATKYIRYLKKSMNEIQCALSFYATNAIKWTIIAIQNLIYIFVGEEWKQPIVLNPRPSNKQQGNILAMCLSKNNNYLSVSLGAQIQIYEIKKSIGSVVLVKNLSYTSDLNTQLNQVNKTLIYCENPIKLAYVDKQKTVGLITCEQIMLFTRVSERSVQHGLEEVVDMDVLTMEFQAPSSPAPQSRFKLSLNKKLTNIISKPKITYLALTSQTQLHVYKVEPSVMLLHSEPLHEGRANDISVRWRYHSQIQTKPQLLVGYGNKIYFYKLMEQTQDNREEVQLQLHLVYQNHYDIKQMEIISTTHLLLLSNSNIIVIAIPLIPSSDLSEVGDGRLRKSSGCGHEMFQSAIVFITSEQDCRILYACQDQVIFYGRTEALRLAKLKSLQQYIDELVLQHGHFREAFTLLILVHKGVDYSFKFSYTTQSLAHSIFSAVQYTISSLRLTNNDNIIEYRLGWVCQLLVETHNEPMIWTTVYNKLKEKQKQRQKDCPPGLERIATADVKNRNHDYESLLYKSEADLLDQSRIQKIIGGNEKEEGKSKLNSRQSLKLEETTSSQLLGKPPKNLVSSLFDILELFVLKSQIGSMPEPIFLQFISYQCQKMSDTVVEKAIIQNRQSYDGSKLLSLLQHKERNYLQLYLFSRAIICEEPDFFTPFIKVFASFKRHAEEKEKGKKGMGNEAGEKMKNTGYLCLWYLCKCLKFEKIPSGVMPLNEKLTIVHTVCVQILEPTLTQKLFQFDHQALLETFLLFFAGGEVSQLLEENNEGLVGRYKQYFPTIYQQIMSVPPSQSALRGESDQLKGEQIFDKSFKQLVVLHLEKTIPMMSTQKQLWVQFQALAFYHCKTEICLSFEATVDILIVLFESKFDAYRLHNYSKYAPRPSVETLELALIDYIKPVLLQRKDRFYINKLTSFNDKHVSYYLHRIDQNYKQALEHFINTKKSKGLISFVHDLLADIEQMVSSPQQIEKSWKEKKIAEIKSFLVKNMGILFKIDKFQALNIFYRMGETSQTIYKLIEQNLGNKLDFLTAVLKKFEHEDFQMKQKLQLQHLSEVCMLRDKQMLLYLNQFYYPLDSAIIVCEQKGNLLAKAIFQQRCGRIKDAFMSYERIVKNIIQSNNPTSKFKSQKTIRKKVHKYTEECLRLCKQYAYDPNSSPENNFWLRIITFTNGFIKSNNQHKVFLKVEFEKVLQHILTEMFQFLPTTFLTDFFITRGHKLELSMTKEFVIYQNLFILAKFDITMAKKVVQICKIDIKDTRKQALYKRKNGMISSGCCDFCKKPLQEQSSCHVYSCRHSFHKICNDDMLKCLTCYFESDNSLFKTNIFGAELQKSSCESRQERIQVEQKLEQEKKGKSMQNIQIIVESAQLVKQESVKKKLKLYDYREEKWSTHFYNMVEQYSEEDKTQSKWAKTQALGDQSLKHKIQGMDIGKKQGKSQEKEREKTIQA